MKIEYGIDFHSLGVELEPIVGSKPVADLVMEVIKKSIKTENHRLPLGIIPENIWLEKRVHELIGALNRYMTAGEYDNSVMQEWAEELERHMGELQALKMGVKK